MSGTGSARPALSAAAGFTLIEMLVVIAIMALVAGLGYPSIERSIAASRFRASAADMGSLLGRARYAALREGRTVRLQLRDGGHGLVMDSGEAVDLVAPLVATADPQTLVFFPDGSAVAAHVALAGPGVARSYAVEPHTGRIDAQ